MPSIARINDLLNPRDYSQAEELLRLWQSMVRDAAHFAATGDADNMINVDFAPELKKMAPYFDDPETAPGVVDNIKIPLADLRRNVHIQGTLMALALRIKSIIAEARVT